MTASIGVAIDAMSILAGVSVESVLGVESTSRRQSRKHMWISLLAIICTVGVGASVVVTLKDSDAPRSGTVVSGVKFTQVEAGADHALALDSDGHIWTWGSNSHGQLGNDMGTFAVSNPRQSSTFLPGPDVPMPTKVLGDSIFVAIAAGDRFSVALDDTGDIWVWGLINDNSLTCSSNCLPTDIRFAPNKLTTRLIFNEHWNHRFDQISVGGRRLLARDSSDRQVFSVSIFDGGSDYLWHDRAIDSFYPSVNDEFTIVVAESGRFYGIGARSGAVTSTTWELFGSGVVSDHWEQIAAGKDHIVGLRANGSLLTWGNNDSGQLCLETRTRATNSTQVTSPEAVLDDIAVVAAAAATTAVIDGDGYAYMCGENSSGQLGNGLADDSTTLTRAGSTRFSKIALADESTFAIDRDGNLWAWGKNVGSSGVSTHPRNLSS